jgi:ferrous iron transport protein B
MSTEYIVGLVGNPNSGKSSLFNQLTGLRQKVGNFPGVTVDKKTGFVTVGDKDITIVDYPGTYSLHPTTQDERVVLNVLSNKDNSSYPNAIVYVADILNLEKHLLLFTQLQDLKIPTILALTMSDLAERKGLEINQTTLSKSLDCDVVLISNRTGQGLEELKSKLAKFDSKKDYSEAIKPFYQLTKEEKKIATAIQKEFKLDTPYQALLWMHHQEKLPFLTDEQRQKIIQIGEANHYESVKGKIQETLWRFSKFTPIVEKSIKKTKTEQTGLTDKVDKIVMHPVIGPAIFFMLMLLVFQAIFTWSSIPMDWIEQGIGALGSWTKQMLPAGWFNDLLTDGIIAGLGGVLVFIPQIAILFLLISILEEIGYMARAVVMFDKIMQKFGLNGRSIVALISGGACAIPAVMSARTISNWKERLITIMVTPLISCSARIPVYIVLIGFVVPSFSVLGIFNSQALAFMGLYLLGIFSALGSAFVFKLILKNRDRSFLTIQLPDYRIPEFRNIGLTVWEKVKTFTLEVGKIIIVLSIALWFLGTYGPSNKMALAEKEAIEIATEKNFSAIERDDLIASKTLEASYIGHLGKFIEPSIRPLGYDWKIGIALITSFAAREVFVGTMATIYSIGSAEGDDDFNYAIRDKMAKEVNPITGEPIYTMATSLSLLLFYVFAMQCMSTLAVVKRETNSWKWPIIQFTFMTVLAYLSAFIAYQWFS